MHKNTLLCKVFTQKRNFARRDSRRAFSDCEGRKFEFPDFHDAASETKGYRSHLRRWKPAARDRNNYPRYRQRDVAEMDLIFIRDGRKLEIFAARARREENEGAETHVLYSLVRNPT